MQSAQYVDVCAAGVTLHRLSVAQYEAMGRAGILSPDDRVELLEGWLVAQMTKNPPHRIATRSTRLALEQVVPAGFYVEAQEPIVTADSEPEPDVAIIRGRTQDYADRNPPAAAVAMVIEIADVSLERDRALKARIYARAGIPFYWIVNLVDRCVEVHTDPVTEDDGAARYRRREVRLDGELEVVVGGSVCRSVAVASLFG